MTRGQGRRWSVALRVPKSKVNLDVINEMKQEDKSLAANIEKSKDGSEWITVYKFHPY